MGKKQIGSPETDSQILDDARELARKIRSSKKGEGIKNLDMRAIAELESYVLEIQSLCAKYRGIRHVQSPLR